MDLTGIKFNTLESVLSTILIRSATGDNVVIVDYAALLILFVLSKELLIKCTDSC